MTPLEAMLELLERVGASQGGAALVSEEELNGWPAEAVRQLKAQKLLAKASPAVSVVCSGCEQACTMPVHSLPAGTGAASSFAVCDKRDDINRVEVPAERLRQWQASGTSIAEWLAGLLGLRHPDAYDTTMGRWEVGLLKGRKGRSHVVLSAKDELTLTLAGYSIVVADILSLEDNDFKLDKQALIRLVDKPVGGAGDAESAAQRRARLMKRVQAEKNKGNRAFLKTVAAEEGFNVSRLKQILHPKPKHQKLGRSAY